MTHPLLALLPGEIVVDSFAGGGGASTGIEAALGRPVDVAINHDPEAVALHRANHPGTEHWCQNVWRARPEEVTRGRPVGLLWASPDCKHFSKAKGGQPVEKKIRDLAWVVVAWARAVRPRVIMLENVEEFATWGPLVPGYEGRMMPCPARRGTTFRRWVNELERVGYRVEWRELRACDHGARTIRKRLFVIARRDGGPIVWPEATHGAPRSTDVLAGRLRPWRSAAECIDWSIACPSIFGRQRPLAEATLKRIANGIRRYVIEAAEPFIVPVTHHGDARAHDIDEPLRTVTTASRGELALVVPSIIGVGGRAGQSPERPGDAPLGTLTAKGDRALAAAFLAPRYGEREGQEPRAIRIDGPMPTVVPTGNGGSLVAAYMEQANTGMTGHDMREPVSTIVGKGCTQRLAAAILSHAYSSNTCGGNGDPAVPMKTVTTGGHHALVRAFLVKYYGAAEHGQGMREPMHTLTAKARMGLVTVAGVDYAITDIGLRMLTPRELFRAQGFPDSYVIDPMCSIAGAPERPLSKTAQVRMCGNSVCPPVAEALVRANLGGAAAAERAA